MNIAAIGACALGLVIGWTVRFFIRRFKTYNAKVLGSVISVMVGGTAIRLLETETGTLWSYLIGLLLGFIVYTVVAIIAGAPKDGVLYSRPIQEYEPPAIDAPRAKDSTTIVSSIPTKRPALSGESAAAKARRALSGVAQPATKAIKPLPLKDGPPPSTTLE